MRRIRTITRKPAQAWYIAPDVKITFLISILEVSLPLFQNKNPQNPIDTPPSSQQT